MYYRKPHEIEIGATKEFIKSLEHEVASSDIVYATFRVIDMNGREHLFADVPEGSLRKCLVAHFNDMVSVKIRGAGSTVGPMVIYYGSDLATAVNYYNELP